MSAGSPARGQATGFYSLAPAKVPCLHQGNWTMAAPLALGGTFFEVDSIDHLPDLVS